MNADSLREVHIHDNWIKGEAIDKLAEFLLKATKLEVLNFSDSTMGTDGAVFVVKALSQSESRKTLRHLACNFNDIETSSASKFILELILTSGFEILETVEFRGNTLPKKVAVAYATKLQEKGCKLLYKEDDEEEDEEEDLDEDEEEVEEGEPIDEEDITSKLAKLML